MITKPVSYLHIQRSVKLLNRVVFFLLLLILFGFAFYSFTLNQDQPFLLDSKRVETVSLRKKKDLVYEKIGTGPFALSAEFKRLPLLDLKEEFLLFGRNTRPDTSLYDMKIHFGLKGSDQSMKVTAGQKLYLAFTEDNHLKFEEKPTPLWVKTYPEKGDRVRFELGVKLVGESEQKLFEEQREFVIFEKLESEEERSTALKEAVRSIEFAKWWGPDRLFEAYGGDSYEKFKCHERIEFESDKEFWGLHVKQGDFYIWDEGRFRKKELGESSKGYPLAYTRLVTPYKIEWDVWDESGLKKVVVGQTRERAPSLNLRMEDVFSRVRQRTASRVSCCVGNKATILKKGDWLLKTKAGWRVLKSIKEVEDVLEFKVKGELFVFDGLEKNNDNQIFLGTLFDLSRTQMQSVKIPLTQQRTFEHSSPTKKAISTKIRPSSLEEEPIETPCERKSRKKNLKQEEFDPTSG